MAARWTVDHDRQHFEIVGEGDIARADVEAVFDGLSASRALGYRKLADLRGADTLMSAEILLALGMRARSIHKTGKMGPLAIVLPTDRGKQAERFIGMLAAAERPFRIFWDIRKARRWLDAQAPAAGVAVAC